MRNEQLLSDETTSDRQERRFKASDDSPLQCETSLEEGGSRRGTVVDLSSSGIRFLCEGRFEVGQTISTELKTNRSHGVYTGVVRRIEPWVDGRSILGCSLNELIPDSVLENLSNEGAVNRRSDDRIGLNVKAKVSWPLHQGEVDVELQDFSSGGMKIVSSVPIPDGVRLRIRIDLSDESPLVVDAKPVWQNESEGCCVAGVTYTHRDTHDAVAQILMPAENFAEVTPKSTRPSRVLRGLMYAACAAAIGLIALMSM